MLWLILAFFGFVVAVLHILLPKTYRSLSFTRLTRKIPGPPTMIYLGTREIIGTQNENYLGMLLKNVNKYGPVLRLEILGQVYALLTDVKDVETVLSSKTYIKKSLDYDLLKPWLGEGLLTSTGEPWFVHRRWLTPAFHFGILEPYVEIFNKNSQILVKNLLKEQKNVPILPTVSLCTLDIVCETAMGKVVNAQEGGAKDYVQAVLEMSKLFQIRQLSPWLYRPFIFDRTSTGQKTKEVLETLHGFTNKVINEKREEFRKNRDNLKADQNNDDTGVKKKRSFLDLLIEISEVEGKLTHEQIREETDTFMFEGHDTTATAISWALFELALNPQVQEAAFQELDGIFGGSDRDVTSADCAEMKYLERVIKETLRLYPSVPIIGRQLEKNTTLGGYEMPAEMNTAVFIYYIHRNPEIYPEPEKFDPDRFLPDRIAKRHPYSYIPFSAGPRNCIGQKFALLEEKVVLSQILRKFRVSSSTTREDLLLLAELILRPKDNVLLNFTPRSNIVQ